MGEEYWDQWVKTPYEPETAKSWIKPEKLREEAERLGMTEKLKLAEITRRRSEPGDRGRGEMGLSWPQQPFSSGIWS